MFPADVMDTMDVDVNDEILYSTYSHDNADVAAVSSSEVSNAIEIITNIDEQEKSTFNTLKNRSDLGTVKKKGRPKGSVIRNETVKKPRPQKTPIVKTENVEPNRLPRMGLQLAHFKLPLEKIQEYQKSQQPFLQPGVCFKIAPKLDSCIECTKFSVLKKKIHGDCRFYHFRKLK